MAKINKKTLVAGSVITATVLAGLAWLSFPAQPEPLEAGEVEIVLNLRNEYIQNQGGKITYAVNGSMEKFFDLLDTDVLTWIQKTSVSKTVEDYVCVDPLPQGQESCQRREVIYDAATYKERMENLLRRANPDF